MSFVLYKIASSYGKVVFGFTYIMFVVAWFTWTINQPLEQVYQLPCRSEYNSGWGLLSQGHQVTFDWWCAGCNFSFQYSFSRKSRSFLNGQFPPLPFIQLSTIRLGMSILWWTIKQKGCGTVSIDWVPIIKIYLQWQSDKSRALHLQNKWFTIESGHLNHCSPRGALICRCPTTLIMT